MRLSRLEIAGFKSFPDQTVVTFQPGISALVGPNGCGKSNLSDAILWALGEQSPKNLRSERIQQIESKALRKLRHPGRSRRLRDFIESGVGV